MILKKGRKNSDFGELFKSSETAVKRRLQKKSKKKRNTPFHSNS
jgi:hypothetical protein